MSCRGPAPNPSSETEKDATRTLLIAGFYLAAPNLGGFGKSRLEMRPCTFPYFSTEFLANTGIIHSSCSLSSYLEDKKVQPPLRAFRSRPLAKEMTDADHNPSTGPQAQISLEEIVR